MQNINTQIKDIQKTVDQLKAMPQFSQYVKMHKLGLIDSKLEFLDRLLDKGIIKD